MEITANLIKDLRDKTAAGVLDCKKALTEANGDLEKAVEILRKSGAAKAEKKVGRITSEGRVSIALDENKAVIVEVNCETDFVAKNPDFQNLVDSFAQAALKNKVEDVETLLNLNEGGKQLKEVLQALITKTGENLSVRRLQILPVSTGEKVGSYIHMGNKIGVLVKAKGSASTELLKDVAMHVAAANPQYLSRADIPQELMDREKSIYLEQMKDSGKPANVLDKIIEGKLAKFADEVSLVSQVYVKDPSGKQTIADYVKSQSADTNLLAFVRYQVGEGLAKKSENFAEEVAKAAGA